jgi:hypothetical protein
MKDNGIRKYLKTEAENEKKKMADMTGREKADYIWTYYKIHILVIVLLIAILIGIGQTIYRMSFHEAIGIMVVNEKSGSSDEKRQEWEKELRETLNLGKKDLVEIDSGITLASGDQFTEYDYAGYAKFSALVASKSVDVILCDKKALERYSSEDAWMDLSSFLPEDLYGKAKEAGNIVSLAGTDGNTIPCAVKLDPVKLKAVSGIEFDEPYIAVFKSVTRQEKTQEFMKYLLEKAM